MADEDQWCPLPIDTTALPSGEQDARMRAPTMLEQQVREAIAILESTEASEYVRRHVPAILRAGLSGSSETVVPPERETLVKEYGQAEWELGYCEGVQNTRAYDRTLKARDVALGKVLRGSAPEQAAATREPTGEDVMMYKSEGPDEPDAWLYRPAGTDWAWKARTSPVPADAGYEVHPLYRAARTTSSSVQESR